MRKWKQRLLAAGLLAVLFPALAPGAVTPDGGVYFMPISCAELLQDASPFLGFFEAVAKGTVAQDMKLSRRIFRILALREKLGDITGRSREGNPVDTLIRRTLCFYREQKEPLKPIAFDDADFLKFLRESVKDLELKVDDTIFQWEFEREQRREYERRLRQNAGVVKSVQKEADAEAERTYDRLSGAARKKVRDQ